MTEVEAGSAEDRPPVASTAAGADRGERARSPEGLTVVLVNWNTREKALRILADLRRERDACPFPIEVVFVDNASEDGSPDAVARHHPWVKVCRQDRNGGFAYGVNRGLREARFPFVLLLNTDVRFDAGDVRRAVEALRTRPEVGVLGPQVHGFDGREHQVARRFPTVRRQFLLATLLSRLFSGSETLNSENYGGRPFAGPTPVDYVAGAVFLLRKSVLETVGPFDERFFMYFEETDFCRRLWRAGWEVQYLPRGGFRHEIGGSSKLAPRRTFLEFQRSRMLYMRLHHGLPVELLSRAVGVVGLGLRLLGKAPCALCPGRTGRASRAALPLHAAGIREYLTFRTKARFRIRGPQADPPPLRRPAAGPVRAATTRAADEAETSSTLASSRRAEDG